MKLMTLVAVSSLWLLSSCSKKDVEPTGCTFQTVDGNPDEIIGKWKLVKMTTSGFSAGGVKTLDFSCSNVIYEFTNTGKLNISSDDAGYGTTEPQEFDALIYRNDEKIIGINSASAQVTATKMILDTRPVDGPLEELFRVE